jgi:hypothetical protein
MRRGGFLAGVAAIFAAPKALALPKSAQTVSLYQEAASGNIYAGIERIGAVRWQGQAITKVRPFSISDLENLWNACRNG